jgi:eukaryotic-like serine/threonine-protein kinase
VKLLSPELCDNEELVNRFLNEARSLQRLRHARIVKVFASGDLSEVPLHPPYMILEWFPVDLRKEMSRVAGPLPARTALRIAWQLADALAEMHGHGLVHRDLKPANVLLSREDPSNWDVKLADLGLAKVLSSLAETEADSVAHVSTENDVSMGTWEYMSPEQWIHSKGVDSKADVYALGVLLFQMVTGQLPFESKQQKDLMYFHLLERPPLERLEGLVPPETRELISRMLGKQPSDRPTMREVLHHTTPAHS